MSVVIIDVYVESVFGVQVPIHGCWENTTHLYNVQYSLSDAFDYVF